MGRPCSSGRGRLEITSRGRPFAVLAPRRGIEREQPLIDIGIDEEISRAVASEKHPELVVDGAFRFDRFSKRPDSGIANSLFSHLTPDDTRVCLGNLRSFAPDCKFFATFRPSDGRSNPRRSFAHVDMRYTVHEMARFGAEAGCGAEYVGEWGHPTGQHMMRYCGQTA